MQAIMMVEYWGWVIETKIFPSQCPGKKKFPPPMPGEKKNPPPMPGENFSRGIIFFSPGKFFFSPPLPRPKIDLKKKKFRGEKKKVPRGTFFFPPHPPAQN
jgi:hypothetical protein